MVKITLKRSKPEPTPLWPEIADLVDRANGGDALAKEELGRTLDRHPELVAKVADLAKHIEQDLIARIAKKSELLKQSLIRSIAYRRKELVSDPQCPIRRLAADRVILHQLEVHLLASKYPDLSEVPLVLARRVETAKDRAERRASMALSALQMLQKLAPKRAREETPRKAKPKFFKIKRAK